MTAARSSTAGAAGLTDRTVQELCDVAQLAVELARRAGADDAEALLVDRSELTAKVRLGEPELVQEAGSRALGLRVLRGGRRAVTYTSDLRREALEALCAETVTLADLAEVDEYALPPDPALLAKDVPEAVGLKDAAGLQRISLVPADRDVGGCLGLVGRRGLDRSDLGPRWQQRAQALTERSAGIVLGGFVHG